MNIGSYAVVSLQNGLVSIAHALMNLITLTGLSLKLEGDLSCGLLWCHRGLNRQQPETRQTGDSTLDAIGVIDHLS